MELELFNNLELEEQKILDYQQTDPYRNSVKEMDSCNQHFCLKIVRSSVNAGRDLFDGFIEYDNDESHCWDFIEFCMRWYSLFFMFIYVLTRFIQILLPLIGMYYSIQSMNIFGIVLIGVYFVLLMMILLSGWKFISYHRIMQKLLVFKSITLTDNALDKIDGYYTECITIHQRMKILEQSFHPHIANMIERYVGRDLHEFAMLRKVQQC